MRWPARFLGAAALVGVAACSRPDPNTRARLDGVPVEAEYVCPKDQCVIWLKTQPRTAHFDVPTCKKPELAETADGKALAHRCDGAAWTPVYLRGGPRYIADCDARLGSAAAPDWSKVGPIEPRAMALLDCANARPHEWAEIARSIGEESGPEAAARFVVASTLHEPEPNGSASNASHDDLDGWVLAFDALAPAAQELVRKETCPALQKASSSTLLYTRAARRCPHDATNVAEVALQAYQNHLGASRRDFQGSTERVGAMVTPTDLNRHELAFVMEGFIALKQRPKEAAQISCDRIGDFSREYDPVRVSVAASILALTKTRCPTLDRKKTDLWPCDLVTPQKSKIAERVAKFGAPPAGAPPALAPANEALFEALTIDGQYPPNWKCP